MSAAVSRILPAIVLVAALVLPEGPAILAGPAEALNDPPTGALTGQLIPPDTIYTANFTDPDGDPLTYVWKPSISCGTFSPNDPEANQAIWSHPNGSTPGTCPHEGTDHPGTVEVEVSDGTYTVACTYDGSGENGDSSCAPAEEGGCTVDVRLRDGNYGTLPTDEDEEDRGAFTVLNANDSDDSRFQDLGENPVAGERDLMRLRLKKPTPDLGGNTVLEVLSNEQKIKFFSGRRKGQQLIPSPTLTFPTSELPRVVWVEGVQKSDLVRDVGLRYSYVPPGSEMGCEDLANATIVWAEFVEALHDAPDAVWGDLSDPPLRALDRHCGGFGLRPRAPKPKGMRNCIGFRFQVFPDGIQFESDVKWDVTRQKRSRVEIIYKRWTKLDPDLQTSRFPDGETPNDDKRDNDESSQPDAGRFFFGFDGPGTPDPNVPREVGKLIYNALFREFMRVRFDGVRPSGNRRSGTAASLEVRWAAAHKLRNRNLKWKRIGGDDPETDTNMVSTR